MKRIGLTRSLANQLKQKWLLLIIGVIIVLLALLIGNALWGNPLWRSIAKIRCLSYFREKYDQDFLIDKVAFSFKIPGYLITLSPALDPQIKFTCNPNCEMLCTSDEYGGRLASNLMVGHVHTLLKAKYGDLVFEINASEDPSSYYGGEETDFFERDPARRLMMNHQNLRISWIDPFIQEDEFIHTARDLAGLLETQLPIRNPNLQVQIVLFDDVSMQVVRYEMDFFLFPTVDPGD